MQSRWRVCRRDFVSRRRQWVSKRSVFGILGSQAKRNRCQGSDRRQNAAENAPAGHIHDGRTTGGRHAQQRRAAEDAARYRLELAATGCCRLCTAARSRKEYTGGTAETSTRDPRLTRRQQLQGRRPDAPRGAGGAENGDTASERGGPDQVRPRTSLTQESG